MIDEDGIFEAKKLMDSAEEVVIAHNYVKGFDRAWNLCHPLKFHIVKIKVLWKPFRSLLKM